MGKISFCLNALERGCKPYNSDISDARSELADLLDAKTVLDGVKAIVNADYINNDSERMFELCQFLESRKC